MCTEASPVLANTLILCNPGSGRVKKQLDKIRHLITPLQQTVYVEACSPDEIEALFREHDIHNKRLLIVIGGDGTFHAVLTVLFSTPAKIPVISLVAAGTTNMSAADFGISNSPCEYLSDLINTLRTDSDIEKTCVSKALLRINNDGRILCGMFLGSGLIAQGVKYYQTHLGSMGVTGEILPGLVFIRFLLSWFFTDHTRQSTNVNLSIKSHAKLLFSGAASLTLVTVLDRLLLGCQPYWNSEDGAIKLTNIVAQPKALLRSFFAVMRGRGKGLDPCSYMSFSTNALSLDFVGGFIVDGELYYSARGLAISVGEFELLHYD